MTRRLTFIFSLSAALAFPAIASANCGTLQGSFSVTCEQGVQVYRHNAPSGIPRGLTPAQASLQAAKLRANTDRLRIESQERSNQLAAKLREREIREDAYRTRILNRNSRRFFRNSSFGTFGGGFNSSRGFGFGQPIRVRSNSLNIRH